MLTNKWTLTGLLSCVALLSFGQANSRKADSVSIAYSQQVTPPKPHFLRLYTFPEWPTKKLEKFRDAAPTTDKTYLDFVGTGDIQKAVSGGQALNANTGAGIIFERYSSNKNLSGWFQSLEVEMSINIATTSDTITAGIDNSGGSGVVTNQRDFGSYMINPQSGKQAIYANANVYFGYPDNWFGNLAHYISGVNLRFIGSNNIWQYNSSNFNVGAYMFRLGIFHEFLPDNVRVDTDTKRAKYSLFLGLNYSARGLVGDITSDQNIDNRMKFLGTRMTTFNGIEFNTGFRLNNLRLEFQVPILNAGKNIQIPGLTNTQFLFTIRFVGGFGLEINTPTGKVTPDKS